MRFAYALFLLLAPLAHADCVNAPAWARICATLGAQQPTSLTSGISRSDAEAYVEREIVKFTGSTCSTSTCTEAQLKGTATDTCWNTALTALCLHISAPVSTIQTSQCQAAADAAPTIAECGGIFTDCAATLNPSLLVIDQRNYCNAYKCDTGDAAACGSQATPTNGTCAAPFPEHPAKCTCAAGQIGSECQSERRSCPTSNADFQCSGHGVCDEFDGSCTCLLDFDGISCATVSCLKSGTISVPCNGHGICHEVGVCQCDSGWVGAECTVNITEEGMTSGEFAGAVIGGLIFSFVFCGITGFLIAKSDD